jgi:hypothetical protein
MRLKRESLDPNVQEDAETLQLYKAMGVATQRMAWNYLHPRRDEFDLAIIGNGTTFEAANVCNVLRRLNISFNTYEKFAFRNVRVMNHGDDFRSFRDLDAVWHNRNELGFQGSYREFAAAKALELVDGRRRASRVQWAWALQSNPEQTANDAIRDAGINLDLPYALVCTNVPFDAGYDKLCRIFPSMRSWLIHTVKILLDRTDLQIVVRAHPGEAAHYGGKERSEDNLATAGFIENPRLIVIPGSKGTNTYGLMERCKFGIVFSSTTGLEMAMLKKRVLVGADVYYSRRGFTVDADDVESYDKELLRLADAVDNALPSESATDAALFHFFIHYVMQWPYPWHKDGDAGALPPTEVVRRDAMRRYLQMLDALATPAEEFHDRLREFLSVERCEHLPRPLSAQAVRRVAQVG